MVWAHVDRPSRITVEYATTESFANARRVTGSIATPDTGLTARVALGELPAGQDIFYRVRFEDVAESAHRQRARSGEGSRTAPGIGRAGGAWPGPPTRCGQGWGIDTSRGGMRLFETMRLARPDLFLHLRRHHLRRSADARPGSVATAPMWRNLTTPAKTKVAETLDEFRGTTSTTGWTSTIRRFNGGGGAGVEWDDHEVQRQLVARTRARRAAPYYTEKRVSVLAARGRQAFL